MHDDEKLIQTQDPAEILADDIVKDESQTKVVRDEDLKRHKPPFKERAAIWYSYNKQKIPFYLMMIATILITASLDFNPQRMSWQFNSHFEAMTWIFFHNNNAFTQMLPAVFFAIYLLAIVSFFIAFSYSKKLSPFLTILLNILALCMLVLIGMYSVHAFIALGNIPAVGADAAMHRGRINTSLGFLVPAFLFIIASMVMSWFYVDWKYTSIDE